MQKIILLIKPLFKKKLTIFTFILLGIIISLSIVIDTYYETLYSTYYSSFKDNRYVNSYFVAKNFTDEENLDYYDIKKELYTIDNVIGVYYNRATYNGILIKDFIKNKYIDGHFELIAATSEALPEIVYGEKYNDDETDEIDYLICPVNFVPAGGMLKKINRFDYLNLKKYLNNELIGYYTDDDTSKESLEINLKLIGLYKNDIYSDDENKCYVKESTLVKMYLNQYHLSEDMLIYKEAGINTALFIVQINTMDNSDQFLKDAEELGYVVYSGISRDYEGFNEITNNVINMHKYLNVALFIFTILILIKYFFDNNKYYKMLYIFGCSKFYISLLHFISSLFLIFFSTLISIIFSLFMKYILKFLIYFKPYLFSKCELVMSYDSLLFVLALVICTSIIISFICSLYIGIGENNTK